MVSALPHASSAELRVVTIGAAPLKAASWKRRRVKMDQITSKQNEHHEKGWKRVIHWHKPNSFNSEHDLEHDFWHEGEHKKHGLEHDFWHEGKHQKARFVARRRAPKSTGAVRLPVAWQAQYTEVAGRAAARVGAAGPRLPLCGRRSAQSLLVELRRAWAPLGRGCLSCGRRSTQSLLVELRRAWALLGRGCLLRGRRSTQSLLVELRRAWAPLGRGCLSCGRRRTSRPVTVSLLISWL